VFTWDGVDFSTAYFDRQPDGAFSQPEGRLSDWLFPPGSFGDEPGTLDGAPVLAMSVAGMLAMKEQFPRLRNGRPWRQKDIDDIEILRGLAAAAMPSLAALTAWPPVTARRSSSRRRSASTPLRWHPRQLSRATRQAPGQRTPT